MFLFIVPNKCKSSEVALFACFVEENFFLKVITPDIITKGETR